MVVAHLVQKIYIYSNVDPLVMYLTYVKTSRARTRRRRSTNDLISVKIELRD